MNYFHRIIAHVMSLRSMSSFKFYDHFLRPCRHSGTCETVWKIYTIAGAFTADFYTSGQIIDTMEIFRNYVKNRAQIFRTDKGLNDAVKCHRGI